MEKFLFDRTFEETPEAQVSADLAPIRKIAFEEGKEAGKTEAYTEVKGQVDKILQSVNILIDSEERGKQYVSAYVLTLCQTIAKKIIPHLYQKGAEQEIKNFVETCLSDIQEARKIKIIVHPDAKERLEENIAPLITASEMRSNVAITVEGDASKSEGDCSVTWEQGGLERSVRHIWSKVDQAMAQLEQNIPSAPVKPEEPEKTPEEGGQPGETASEEQSSEETSEEKPSKEEAENPSEEETTP